MKKLVMLAALASLACSLLAQEAAPADNAAAGGARESAIWPSVIAFFEWPASPDVVGLRFTIPYSTVQQNVTGLDIGFWGRSTDFEGIQVNIIRNDVKDSGAGFQIGLYNSVGRVDLAGLQVGLFNEAGSLRGIQAGVINVAGEAEGLQVGLVNRAETMHGFQVGVINVIREAELQFMPVCNIGF